MRKMILTVVAIALLAGSGAQAQVVTVDEVLAKVLITDALVDDFTADVVQNQGEPEEVRGTAVYQKGNNSRVDIDEDGIGAPLDRLLVANGAAFSVVDNDADTVVNRDLLLDPTNADFRALHRLISVSPILQWRFLGGGSTATVDPGNQYTLAAVGCNVDVRVTVDTSLGVVVGRELYLGPTLAVQETWSNFVLVDSLANLPTRYEVSYPVTGDSNTTDFSNYVLNQDPDPRLFREP